MSTPGQPSRLGRPSPSGSKPGNRILQALEKTQLRNCGNRFRRMLLSWARPHKRIIRATDPILHFRCFGKG